MHLISMLFWNVLATLSLIASAFFAIITIIAAFTLFSGLTDQELSGKDRCMLGLLMLVTVAWGAWLTYFSNTLGLSLLTI